LRIATTDNNSTLNFRNNVNEDGAGVDARFVDNRLDIVTRVNNMNIRISPHGTGKINLPNVPSGSGDVLARDSSNNLVRVPVTTMRFLQKALAESKNIGAFTSAPLEIQGLQWVSVFNSSNLTGSRSFTASTECSQASLYRIKGTLNFSGDTSAEINIRIDFFGQSWYSGFTQTVGSSTSINYPYSFEFYLSFGNDGSDKYRVGGFVRRATEDIPTLNNLSWSINHQGTLSSAISGSSDFDILAGGETNASSKVYDISCERLI
jgi:hypothetical protein